MNLICYYCHKYGKEFSILPQNLPDLAKEHGVNKGTIPLNNDMLNKHPKTPVHQEIVGRVEKGKQQEFDDFLERKESPGNPQHIITGRHMRDHVQIYQEEHHPN